ncbi:unnamed protein product [Rotaria sp. Silwood2]|nr:unnamed protein product [Rotaria sp. Silwood2]CAF4135605.1 unnamed protein product [Rotaria sp. Silwood2]
MDTTYTLVKLPDDSSAVTGTLSCTMKYTVKDCDRATGEPDNEEDATSSDPGTTAITMQLTICSTDQSVVQVIALAIEETFIYFY